MRALLVALPLAITACFRPDIGETPFRCASTGKPCPDGYECDIKTRICNREGQASKDFGPADQRILTDAESRPSKEGPVFLDGALIKPSTGCADESSEPNNTFGTATTVAGQGLIPDWQICYPGDVDHFAIDLKPGDKLSVKVRFTHAKGDLEAALLDPDVFLIFTSRGVTDVEELKLTLVPKPAKYVFAVYGFGRAVNKYDLDISITR